MNRRLWVVSAVAVAFGMWFATGVGAAVADSPERAMPRQILDATGVQGGLIVHLGCGDGNLTAGLRASDSYLVHGLDSEANSVAAARKHIQSLGLYGNVSAEHWTGPHLPYIDNLVNLVVAESLGAIPMAECQLESPPVFDGMIAANGRLYIATMDGRVICLGGKNNLP